jgi:ribosome-associated protein
MAQKLLERIKQAGGSARVEGLANADWVLIDTGDIIVHLFRPEVRSFYNLERMWAVGEDAPAALATA